MPLTFTRDQRNEERYDLLDSGSLLSTTWVTWRAPRRAAREIQDHTSIHRTIHGRPPASTCAMHHCQPGAYSACVPRTLCPCSADAVGSASEVHSMRELVRSRASSTILRWPIAAAGEDSSAARQLMWLRKFRGVRVDASARFPTCGFHNAYLSRK